MSRYEDALRTIYGYINRRAVLDTERPARTRRLLELTGRPHDFLQVVHVTGTKGKGSVCAMLSAALLANGYRVGLYTSPHLHSLRERIQVDGDPISEDELADLVERLQMSFTAVEGLAFPEVMTALVLHYFVQRRVDVAVIEVHVGGMFDATNVLQYRTLASVINTIDYDHTDILGDTLASIAYHKTGIIQRQRPVISAEQPLEARRVITEEATLDNAQLTTMGSDVAITIAPPNEKNQAVLVSDEHFETNLRGVHQGANLALAVTTLRQIDPNRLLLRNIHAGWDRVVWPGRLETVIDNDGVSWLLDIAHNPAAARALADYLDTVYGGRRRVIVYGSKADKNVEAILSVIVRRGDELVLAATESPPTAPPTDLLPYAPRERVRVVKADGVVDAMGIARRIAGEKDLLLVTGSIFVVAVARAHLLHIPAEYGSAR
ncbi:MAG: cyanophycin synthetase [Chloroflexota bacterium]